VVVEGSRVGWLVVVMKERISRYEVPDNSPSRSLKAVTEGTLSSNIHVNGSAVAPLQAASQYNVL
jgi:hypothetical protein